MDKVLIIKSCYDSHVRECGGKVKFSFEEYKSFWQEHSIGDWYKMKNNDGSHVMCKVAYYPLKHNLKEKLDKYRNVIGQKQLIYKDLRALIEIDTDEGNLFKDVPIYYLERMDVDSIMKEICDTQGIDLIQIQEGDKYCEANGIDAYINSGYASGHIINKCIESVCGAEIQIGIFKDQELKLYAFFHELGHVIHEVEPMTLTIYEMEKECWDIGREEAAKMGITFSSHAIQWGKSCAEKYNTYEYNTWNPYAKYINK